MQQEMTDSNVVDLYEEMLYKRAAKGIRPVLYISSPKDLKCSLVVLLEEASAVARLPGWRRPTAIGLVGRRHLIMTH
jgi:hypothetical protein